MLLISFSLGAQSLKEAEKLSSSKKYAEAAEIYYSLGYYGKAAEAFRKHVSVQPSGRRKKVAEALNQKIRHLEQLDRMTLNCENVQIIDSIIIAKSEFLKAYRLSEEAGSLISAGESTIYETQLKD
ncbi:MAG: hypothetical protein LBF79_05060, partial [Dysgonamonadaceae bacterium]|nr:hypothetical protein [Dysgonamonadaceae bacterium]